jgi:hypothetical protein
MRFYGNSDKKISETAFSSIYDILGDESIPQHGHGDCASWANLLMVDKL